MKLPLAHPSLEPFRRYQQKGSTAGPVAVRFLGTSSMLFTDGETSVLSDGFVTRPGMLKVLAGRLAPDRRRIQDALARIGADSIAAVFCGHSHYDHALDAPVVAQLTGAVLLGDESTANVGLGAGLTRSSIHVVENGEVLRFGKFALTFIESEHSPGDIYPGTVDAPLVPPARASAWKCGTTYSVLVQRENRTILVHGSANYRPGALHGRHADVIYLGIGKLGKQTDAFVDAYWDRVVRDTGAKRVILVHWDDFFRSLDHPLRPLPYIADNFTASMQRVLRRARADGVEVLLPVPWEPTDPFAGLS